MVSLPKSSGIAVRVIVAVACCLGIWYSLLLARADFYFKKDTGDSIRKAVHLVPDGWPYYMRLAQFDRDNARQLLDTALRLNPYDAQADIELGLQYEAEGDYGTAEKQLLKAYSIDHTYMPRWSLANFYFRQDNLPRFWFWARSAAAMPSDDIGGLLELCWHAAPDAATITGAILNEKPEFLRQYIRFLVAKDQLHAAAQIAPHLVQAGDPQSDLPVLFSVVNGLIGEADSSDALAVWHLLASHNWAVADSSTPNNASFARIPLPVRFDWSLPEYKGLHSWPGPSGLRIEFSGSEPEDCLIAEQSVVLNPGDYVLSFDYRTAEIPPSTGIRWQILDAKSKLLLAQSNDLSKEQMDKPEVGFTVPPESSLLTLRLWYKRTLGTVRVSGTLNVEKVQIQAQSQTRPQS